MADTVTSQTIVSGPRNFIMKFTNESDGTGESAVVKVAAANSSIHLKIARVVFAVNSGTVRLQWNATTPTDALILSGFGTFDYQYFGGLPNPNNSGADGAIKFTTVGFAANSSYDITLEMIKAV
jgi:hypothetical protein